MDSFREVYERHYGSVYRLALFLTGAPDQADDLAAETFVRAWTARDRLQYATVRAYLLTITRNLYRDQLRASRHFVELHESLATAAPPPAERVERASTLREIRARLPGLAAGDRRALLLYAVCGLSYADVAGRLGISLNAVKSRIARAREALRDGGRPPETERIGK
jgi:RNA polymerase sigma-70 factor (ECF subfamily)